MGNGVSEESEQGGSWSSSQEREEVDFSLPPKFTRKYEVVGKIGKGSFGDVYKVRDVRTKAVYAAKHVEYSENNMKEVCYHNNDQYYCRVYTHLYILIACRIKPGSFNVDQQKCPVTIERFLGYAKSTVITLVI